MHNIHTHNDSAVTHFFYVFLCYKCINFTQNDYRMHGCYLVSCLTQTRTFEFLCLFILFFRRSQLTPLPQVTRYVTFPLVVFGYYDTPVNTTQIIYLTLWFGQYTIVYFYHINIVLSKHRKTRKKDRKTFWWKKNNKKENIYLPRVDFIIILLGASALLYKMIKFS